MSGIFALVYYGQTGKMLRGSIPINYEHKPGHSMASFSTAQLVEHTGKMHIVCPKCECENPIETKQNLENNTFSVVQKSVTCSKCSFIMTMTM